MGKYTIKYWESEEAREYGISEILSIENDKNEAIEKAKKFFYDSLSRAIEVVDNNENLIYHVSYDENGEIYTETIDDSQDNQTDNTYVKDYCTVPEVDSSDKDTNKNKSTRKNR